MTATELARQSNVSRVTLAAIEESRTLPKLETVANLATALNVSPSWIAFGERISYMSQAPHFEESEVATKLESIANSVGGFVDQKYLYIEPAGAAAWMRLESVREFPVLRDVADLVAKNSPGPIIELVSLGSGTAQAELQFLNYLKGRFSLKVALVDVSHSLLRRGYENILNGIGNRLHSLVAIQGNMEELNCFHESLRVGLHPSRRVVSMFGYTFSNLHSEMDFIQNALLGFDEGDFVLLEVALHDLPVPITEAAVRKSDPTLQGNLYQEFDPRSIDFFSGPLLRNRRNVQEVKVSRTVQIPSVIPNSYAVGPIVTAIDFDGKKAEFKLAKANRYHLESLTKSLQREGNKLIHRWRYGEPIPCAILRFEFCRRG